MLLTTLGGIDMAIRTACARKYFANEGIIRVVPEYESDGVRQHQGSVTECVDLVVLIADIRICAHMVLSEQSDNG